MNVWIVAGVGVVAWSVLLWVIVRRPKQVRNLKMPYEDHVTQRWLDDQHSQPPSARRRD